MNSSIVDCRNIESTRLEVFVLRNFDWCNSKLHYKKYRWKCWRLKMRSLWIKIFPRWNFIRQTSSALHVIFVRTSKINVEDLDWWEKTNRPSPLFCIKIAITYRIHNWASLISLHSSCWSLEIQRILRRFSALFFVMIFWTAKRPFFQPLEAGKHKCYGIRNVAQVPDKFAL